MFALRASSSYFCDSFIWIFLLFLIGGLLYSAYIIDLETDSYKSLLSS